MSNNELLLKELLTLIEDYHDYNPGEVQHETELPSAVAFCKQVAKGLPCVYAADQALLGHRARTWGAEYLIDTVHDGIEVATTPDGRADSLCSVKGSNIDEQIFLQPANVTMSMQSFLQSLNDTSPDSQQQPVRYLQSQNSNLTSTNLSVLLEDLPSNFVFAQEVLGEPEAINIWIGDERSVTSTHRDPFENLYIVLRGSKTFTLWPPVDEICMDAKMVSTGCYVYEETNKTFKVVMDGDDENPSVTPQIPWVPIDPHVERTELDKRHPMYQYAKPRTVTVEAGQMLYLPSGWYHHVAQKCGRWDDGSVAPCIAVNYWVGLEFVDAGEHVMLMGKYDMEYEGEKHVTRQLIGRLTALIQQEKKVVNGG